MSFDWAEYLSIAERLAGMPVSGPPAGIEAEQRSAVSRAYYAAFVSARNRLRDVDGIRDRRLLGSHRLVAKEYEAHIDPRRIQIGIELGRLRAGRTRCDYNDNVSAIARLLRASIMRARRLLLDLAQL